MPPPTRRGSTIKRNPLTDIAARRAASTCFVCGPANPAGLRIRYRLEDEVCRAEFTPGDNHAGYDRITHGGIIYSVLDDVMANWLFLKGARAYTARCEIRYRQPLPVGTPLRLEGRLVARRGKLAHLEGRALRADDGTLVAEAEASFMVVDPDAFPAGDST